MSYFYLASPYSKFSGGIVAAFEEVCEQAALLVRAGVPVFSPIAHTHSIALHGHLDPYDLSIWLEADRAFMDAAKAIIVCKMDGWQESYGIGVEVEHFKRAGKPVHYMEPGFVPPEVLPKRRRVLGLTGYAGAGKDCAAQALVADGWTRVAFADAVRAGVRALDPVLDGTGRRLTNYVTENGWDAAKKHGEVRALLQRYGTEAGRDIHGPDCWVKIVARKLAEIPGDVVITDVRFQQEVEFVKSQPGSKICRIERPGVGPVNAHSSESQEVKPDVVVCNSGTAAELHAAIRAVAKSMRVPGQPEEL
jgi:hypothetical protein